MDKHTEKDKDPTREDMPQAPEPERGVATDDIDDVDDIDELDDEDLDDEDDEDDEDEDIDDQV